MQYDLFEDKFKRVPLKDWFDDYDGRRCCPCSRSCLLTLLLCILGGDDPAAGSKFIESKFLAVNKTGRSVFVHQTCATDTRNVERVRA